MTQNPFDIYTSEYEEWFKENPILFKSELLALKQAVPINKKGLEIGVGSGLFAKKLNIEFGIDPSENMLKLARQRNIKVTFGRAEELPYPDNYFDFTIFITSICFIENPLKAFQEAYRVTKQNGHLIVAFIDKESTLGQTLMATKNDSKFYKPARFYSVQEIISLMEESHYQIEQTFQTLIDLTKNEVETPIKGFGKGSFVVIQGVKK